MSGFFDKFNMYSDGKFSFLKLSLINVTLSSNTAELCFVCPEDKFEAASNATDEIKNYAEQALESLLTVSVKITKSYFDEHFFTLDLIRFFAYYPSLKGCVDKRCIKYTIVDGTHKVKVTLKESAYQVFNGRGLIRELCDFVRNNYCENIEVEIIKSDELEDSGEEYTEKFSYEDTSGRFIRVINAEGLIGLTIYQPATYISDAAPCELAVLCGKIKNLKTFQRKQKDGKEMPNFYKFTLSDTTGDVEAVCFPSDKTKDRYSLLNDGSEIIAEGKLEFNEFKDRKTLTFYPRRISLCGFPDGFKINRLKMNVPVKYAKVFPNEYIEYKQSSFLGALLTTQDNDDKLQSRQSQTDSDGEKSVKSKYKKDKPTSNLAAYNANINHAFFKGKTFCVFDIETTGLDRHNDKIIEIGAVKIVDGILTETFSALIDPQTIIPEKITKLTGLTNTDVKDAYLLEEILPDLLKFFGDSIICGFNSEFFDYPFLSNASIKHDAYIDNKRLDVYLLAKQYLKLEQFRLKDVAEHYGVVNENAHRALDDAIVTAKILIAMSSNFDFEP